MEKTDNFISVGITASRLIALHIMDNSGNFIYTTLNPDSARLVAHLLREAAAKLEAAEERNDRPE